MSPFWGKLLWQVAVTAVKKWWSKKDEDKEEKAILDDVNKALNERKK